MTAIAILTAAGFIGGGLWFWGRSLPPRERALRRLVAAHRSGDTVRQVDAIAETFAAFGIAAHHPTDQSLQEMLAHAHAFDKRHGADHQGIQTEKILLELCVRRGWAA